MPNLTRHARRRIDLISAALRHTRDAEHLVAPGLHQSIDQAAHLAGFGPECIRKASLGTGWADKAIGHGVDEGTALTLVLDLDPHAARLCPTNLARRFPTLAKWSPESRYQRTGTADAIGTAKLVAEARQLVQEVLVRLYVDGAVSDGALR